MAGPKKLAALRAALQGTPGTLRLGTSTETIWQDLANGLEKLARAGASAGANEDGLTQRLFEELQIACDRRPYFFDKQHMTDPSHGQSPKVDLAVKSKSEDFALDGVSYGRRDVVLAVEAKRLPTIGTGREREYLYGSSATKDLPEQAVQAPKSNKQGGLERFKRGKHGPGLKTVGMIGYVQRHSFDHWRKTIHGWLDELIAAPVNDLPWSETDRLQEERKSERLAWLRSSTRRITDNQVVTVRHLWVQLGASQAG